MQAIQQQKGIFISFKKYSRKKCFICECNCVNKVKNTINVDIVLKMFIEYMVLFDMSDIIFCFKKDCFNQVVNIINIGDNISYYFELCQNWKYMQVLSKILKQNEVATLLNRYVYTISTKQIDRCTEIRYNDIPHPTWYEYCALSKEQFKQVIDEIEERLLEKGMLSLRLYKYYNYCICVKILYTKFVYNSD